LNVTGIDAQGGGTDAVAADSDRTDAALLARVRDGDAAAFWKLMDRYNQRLFRIARTILRDEDEAEDTVQETYVRALSAIDRFRGEASVSTWLARIAINESLGRLRRRRPMVSLNEVGDESPPARLASAMLPEAIVARGEIRALIEAAIDRLPLSLRTVFVMRAIEQMTIKEASAALDIPPQTVKTRFFRARRLLRRALEIDLGTVLSDVFPFAGRRCEELRRRVLARFGLVAPDGVKTS
jgi:RNA polymerase sigma-70 factor, ECF subfamily